MKKILLILLCVPLIGFGQHNPNKGSQVRVDISNAIRNSYGSNYLCVYSQLEVLDRFAIASFRLKHKSTNNYLRNEEFNILLINDLDSGWLVYNKDCYDWPECLEWEGNFGGIYSYFSEIHFNNREYLQAINSINQIIFWAETFEEEYDTDNLFDEYINLFFKCHNKSVIPICDTLFACTECKEIYTYSYLYEEASGFIMEHEPTSVVPELVILYESKILRSKYLSFVLKENISENTETKIEEVPIEEVPIEEKHEINKKSLIIHNNNEGNEENNSGDGNMGDGEGFGYRLFTIEDYRSKPKDFDYSLKMGEGYVTINVIVNSQGIIIDIDDNSFTTNLGFIGKTKREEMYKSIKRDLKYGPGIGNDKSDKIATLKIVFTN